MVGIGWGATSLPVLADCHTYYVANGGDDSQAGTVESPWQTLGRAARSVAACDTVVVRGGTYFEAVILDHSGAPGAPIRWMAYPGESPVLDGQNVLPVDTWHALIDVRGDYVDVSGFELKNSAQYGLYIGGQHNAVRDMNVHHSQLNGVTAAGDDNLVEGSRVWQNSLMNFLSAGNGSWGAGLTAARDPVNGITDGATLRRNVVYQNWGEGLSTFEADGTRIEDNVVYDNMHVNLYVSDASRALVQRNLVYSTPDSVTLFGRPSQGIALSNETARNPLNRITIVNNVVYGTAAPFVYFVDRGPNAVEHALIAHNTLVNAQAGPGSDGITVVFSGGAFNDVHFMNNIVVQDDASAVLFVAAGQTGLSFSSNLWSKPPPSQASAANDVIGDPLFRKFAPGVDRFKLKRRSPALRRATVIDEITDDFFRKPRTPTPDIGANQRSR